MSKTCIVIFLILSGVAHGGSIELFKECELDTQYYRGYISGYMSALNGGEAYRNMFKFCFPENEGEILVSYEQLRLSLVNLGKTQPESLSYSENLVLSKTFSINWPCEK